MKGKIMQRRTAVKVLLAALCVSSGLQAQPRPVSDKPTVVLVHGAFADSSSWNGVIDRLSAAGYKVVAAANPLRSLSGDADYVAALVKTINGPVLLVGHSYGGEVISEAASQTNNVRGLVFVAGFAPDVGESAATLSAKFPGATLNQALSPPVPQPEGGNDLYIAVDKFWQQFAADVPQGEAIPMAVGQRPITEKALNEKAGAPSWKKLPSWFIFGSLDRNITRDAHAFMAARAKSRETIEVLGASHVVMVSNAPRVAELIQRAANAQ